MVIPTSIPFVSSIFPHHFRFIFYYFYFVDFVSMIFAYMSGQKIFPGYETLVTSILSYWDNIATHRQTRQEIAILQMSNIMIVLIIFYAFVQCSAWIYRKYDIMPQRKTYCTVLTFKWNFWNYSLSFLGNYRLENEYDFSQPTVYRTWSDCTDVQSDLDIYAGDKD